MQGGGFAEADTVSVLINRWHQEQARGWLVCADKVAEAE